VWPDRAIAKEAKHLPNYTAGDIQRLAAPLDLLVTRLRADEYLLYDNETNHLLLGSVSGGQKTGVSLEQIQRYLQRFHVDVDD
jgi:hypothetical protein